MNVSRRGSRRGSLIAVGLMLAMAFTIIPTAEAAPHRALTISSASAHPSHEFKAFDVTPKAFDFNGDGRKEIVVHNDNRFVYVFDSKDGRLLAEISTRYPTWWGARPLNSVEASAFTIGGTPHIVAANSAAYINVYRFDGVGGDGKFLFKKVWDRRLTDCYGDPGMDAKPVLADLSGDGRFEILAQTEESGVYALRLDGSTYWKQCIGGGNGEPAVADIDRDGVLDVVWASDGGAVTAMDGRTGRTKWTYWVTQHNVGAGAMPVGPSIGQVDGSGPLDVVVGVRDSHDRQDPANNHAALVVIKGDGRLLWVRQHPQANPLTYTHPIIHDIDKDGTVDILWGDWNTEGHKPGNWAVTGPANYYRYDAWGNLKWRVSMNTYWSNKDLALADVDADGRQEVVVNAAGCNGDGLWFLDGRTGAKEGCVSTHPWKVTRGPVVEDLWGWGTMQIVVPVYAATDGVRGGGIMVFDTGVRYSSAWPHPPDPVRSPSGPTQPPPPATGDFDAQFTPVAQTNNWWVEAKVTGNRPITKVEALVENDAPRTLDKQSWGNWAKSFHVADGATVRFRAWDDRGQQDTSAAFTWGDASAPPPATFDAHFTAAKGANEWWVDVKVLADRPLASVTASVGGTTHQLSRTDWGTWAKSFHAPRGSTLTLTATASDGSKDTDTMTWLSGSETPPPGGFTAGFDVPDTSNNWWVEVYVKSDRTVGKVEAQVDGGTWTTLEKQSWGSHAKSFHVAHGAQVKFRATASDGATATSTTYTWS